MTARALRKADLFRYSDLQSAYKETAFGLSNCVCGFFLLFYKESAFGFGISFWLHQRGIPHRMCRFYYCLAAHQRTRKKASAEPSFPILWTPPHPPLGYPLRRGISAAAGLGQFRNPVSGAGRSSPLRYIVWVLCVRAEVACVSENFVGHMSLVFHYWMEKRRC